MSKTKKLKDPCIVYFARIRWIESDKAYMVTFPGLMGCMTCGYTLSEALSMAEDALSLWLYVTIEKGHRIPTPRKGYRGPMKEKFPIKPDFELLFDATVKFNQSLKRKGMLW